MPTLDDRLDALTHKLIHQSGLVAGGSSSGGPSGLLAQTQRLVDQDTVGSTSLDTMTLNVTIPAGRVLRIHWYEPNVFGTVTADNFLFSILQDGVQIQDGVQDVPSGNDNLRSPHIVALISPSAGTHTYTARCTRTAGTGSLKLTGASGAPALFWIEDITGTAPAATGAPSSTLAYAEVTAPQTGISTETNLAGLAVTITVPAGRRIRISGQVQIQSATTAGTVLLRIKEGSTEILRSQENYNTTAGNGKVLNIDAIVVPTAGSHTYNLSLQGTAGTIDSIPAPFQFILVEDITGVIATTDGATGSTLAYAQVTANQAAITLGSSTSPTDLTGLSVTVTVPDGRRIKVTGYVYQYNRVAGTVTYVATQVREGNTELSRFTEAIPNTYGGGRVEAILSPTAGTHTYKLSAYTDGTVDMAAGATTPCFILVEDITGSVWPAGVPVIDPRYALRAVRATSNQALTVGGYATVVFNSEAYDEGSVYNPATGEYTVPLDGLYRIDSSVRLGVSVPPFFASLSLFRNGVNFAVLQAATLQDNFDNLGGGTEGKFGAGDVLTVRVFIGAGEVSPIIDFVVSSGEFNWLTIRRVAG